MLLTLTCETENATDLGYLLHKHPDNLFEAKLWFGTVTVFYPEAESHRCTAALLLDVDPVGLVRGRQARTLDQYVNDRPYVASSLLSVALIEAFGSAMNGRSKERAERVSEPMRLRAHLSALNCPGGEELLPRLFEPLGYTVTAARQELDARFPEWGASSVFTVTLDGVSTVQNLLTYLYVLVPVLDNSKHYFVGTDEVDKLLAKGGEWLPSHPERDLIARRYLNYRAALIRDAQSQLQDVSDDATSSQAEQDREAEAKEERAEKPMHLNQARMEAALEAVRSLVPSAHRVLDLGCGEGKLLQMFLNERGLTEIVGVDVASYTLERASQRLRLDRMTERQRERVKLLQGSLVYRDDRFVGFDVALLIEVIEHLDPPRLAALEGVVFGHARPRRIVVTTPNAEYNPVWASLPAGKFRHGDHRFEWTRAQFQEWTQSVAGRNGYDVTFSGIGPEDTVGRGTPTQMAVFDLAPAS